MKDPELNIHRSVFPIPSYGADLYICDAAPVWGRLRQRNTLENASYRGGRAANDLTIPQPKVMAAYGLYSPATAKQIKNEMRQTHTYFNKRPLDLEEGSFHVNLSVNAAGVPQTASA